MSKNKTEKRSIKIHGINKELDIEGGVVLNLSENSDKSFIHIEKMKSGRYKLFVTSDITEDLTKILSLEIVRL